MEERGPRGTGSPPPMSSVTSRTSLPPRKVAAPRSHSPQPEALANDGTLVRSSASRDLATIPIGNESVGTQPSLSQHGSFFQSSRNVSINGGEFNSSRLHHTNLTINFNHSGSEDTVDIDRSGQAAPLRTSPHELAVSRDNLQRDAQDPASSGRTQEGYTTINPFHQAPLPIQKSSDLYYQHLATKGRGSPLWIPEPNRNLPIEYQRKGISIGDVGILTDNGGFDFLFNICLPRDDPINPEEMPEDFHPLRAPGTRDIINNLEFKANSYLASSSVKSSQRDGESLGLSFESSASEGAILTMPRGSPSRDLANKINFKRYASANIVKWYRYVNEVCGREAKNGDIRLVVGVNPATSWGMATFANLSEQSAFLLRFKPIGERAFGGQYGWEYSGTAEVKSGPDKEETEALRKLDREAGQEGSDIYENQTLFVRTINATIQDDTWNKLSAQWEELYFDDDSNDSLTNKGTPSSDTPNSTTNVSTGAGPVLEEGNSHNAPQEGSASFKRHKQFHSVYLSESPSTIASHPSITINRLLLEKKPDSRLAITEDEEWISVMRKGDKVLPPSETLFDRIMVTHDICEDEGVVFFRAKNAPVYQIVDIPEDYLNPNKFDENALLSSPKDFQQARSESTSLTSRARSTILESGETPDNIVHGFGNLPVQRFLKSPHRNYGVPPSTFPEDHSSSRSSQPRVFSSHPIRSPIEGRKPNDKEVTDHLQAWLQSHPDQSHPSLEERKQLRLATGLSMNQVLKRLDKERHHIYPIVDRAAPGPSRMAPVSRIIPMDIDQFTDLSEGTFSSG